MKDENATTPYHHGDLHATLRQVAWEIVGEAGLRGLTLRECARRAGVSHAAPAHHFGSLAGLIAEVAADGYERMVTRIDEAVASSDDKVLACGLAYIRFAMDYPQQFRLMLGTHIDEPAPPRWREASGQALQRLRQALYDAWVDRHGKPPRKQVLDERLAMAWSAGHGYALLAIDHHMTHFRLPPPRKVFATLMVGLLEP